MSRTIEQRTNFDGFPKAGELIEMTGLEDIDASQRAISNLLYRNRCGGITYKFCARVEMMSSVAD